MFPHLMKAVFVWVVVCILSAKTIVAAVYHTFFKGRGDERPSIWITLILLLCLSGPFTLRATGGMNGLEGALWIVFTTLFIFLLKVERSMVLDSICWKALRIQEYDEDPVGCTIGVGGLLLGLYGVFLANYHFPENMR